MRCATVDQPVCGRWLVLAVSGGGEDGLSSLSLQSVVMYAASLSYASSNSLASLDCDMVRCDEPVGLLVLLIDCLATL